MSDEALKRYRVFGRGWYAGHLSKRTSESGDGTVLAATPEGAVEAFCAEAWVSLCHQCSDEAELSDLCHYTVIDESTGEEVYNDLPKAPPAATARWAIRRYDGLYYTHGYPGSWNEFPRLQIYHAKGAATRQSNKFCSETSVVVVGLVPPAPK